MAYLQEDGLKTVFEEVKKQIDKTKSSINTDVTNQLETVTEQSKNLIDTIYSDLKTLRDNNKLTPGTQYRIIDYQCTTTQADTTSAGHQFDIIVVADSSNKLNEVARAIRHTNDSALADAEKGKAYFANSKLEAWKIWYCLDNDTNRFAWADATNGKGVIYRMIDEFNNDCPYDFKNIQFKRYKITKANQSALVGTYLATDNPQAAISIDTNDFIWCYTFSNNSKDSSINSSTVHTNIIKPEINAGCAIINNIVFLGGICSNNIFGNSCSYNSFGSICSYNSFGNDCSHNSFGNSCSYNIFGNNCSDNSFGINFLNNTIGDYNSSNKFENNVQYVEFSGKGTTDKYIQNYHIKQGMTFTLSTKHTITAKAGLNYETTVAKKSDGTVVEYCEADLLNSISSAKVQEISNQVNTSNS